MFELLNPVFLMAPQGGGDGGGGMIMTLVMFGAIILIMYFLMIRPQQKRQKEHQAMLESLKKGDKVIMNSGFHGTITDIDGKTYTVQIADNVKVKVEKNAVASKE
jgi:preprotein translocase subunit YajC